VIEATISLRFNPCFVGCYSESWEDPPAPQNWSGFNPCFVGCYSERFFSLYALQNHTEFQSLFCWMLFWKTFTPTGQNARLGFNPCFVGCYSESHRIILIQYINHRFQSLFCWMLFWKIKAIKELHELSPFQSLFCWMLFWKLGTGTGAEWYDQVSILVLLDVILKEWWRGRRITDWPCFNPCFVGCYSESWIQERGRRKPYQFQSLFCWMLFWKFNWLGCNFSSLQVSILVLLDVILKVLQLSHCCIQVSSFNPCFVGCYSESSSFAIFLLLFIRFQSLFCWMLFWKLMCIGLQSCSLSCFNPCFVGCYSESLILSMVISGIMVVSILVLLDVILKAQLPEELDQ